MGDLQGHAAALAPVSLKRRSASRGVDGDGREQIAQLPRAAGEKHPYETDAATVQRYFEMGSLCAEAQRLAVRRDVG